MMICIFIYLYFGRYVFKVFDVIILFFLVILGDLCFEKYVLSIVVLKVIFSFMYEVCFVFLFLILECFLS